MLRKISVVVASLLVFLTGCSSLVDGEESLNTGATIAEIAQSDKRLCAPVDDSRELSVLTVGNSNGGLTEAFIAWGTEEGCFAKHGLSIDSIPAGGINKVAGLVGGSLDIAAETTPTALIAMANSDVQLKLISGHYEITADLIDLAKTTPALRDGKLIIEVGLFVSPSWPFENLSDLKGARIGTSTDINPTQIGLERAIEEAGLGVDDIELVPLGNSERITALLAGEIDAATFGGARAYQALDAGAQLVLYPAAYFYEPSPVVTWMTTADTASLREEEILLFREALREIYALLLTQEGQESYFSLLRREFEFDDTLIEQYSFPPLMMRDITVEELLYLPGLLKERGLIDREIDVSADILFP